MNEDGIQPASRLTSERRSEILLATLAVLIRKHDMMPLNSSETERKLRIFMSCPEFREIKAVFKEVREVYKEAYEFTLKARRNL